MKKVFVLLLCMTPGLLLAAKTGYQVGYGKTQGIAHEKAKEKVNKKSSCGSKWVPVGPFETKWKKQSSNNWKVTISYSCKKM
ncbi:hypothetical protein [Amphritea japonica]|uniref:hypothetical protein n=1 Tax=Amphritea japonica TaxID=452627 RepID=UPI00036E844E|nr:hypothetical protein [Amphritea japonica]